MLHWMWKWVDSERGVKYHIENIVRHDKLFLGRAVTLYSRVNDRLDKTSITATISSVKMQEVRIN